MTILEIIILLFGLTWIGIIIYADTIELLKED